MGETAYKLRAEIYLKPAPSGNCKVAKNVEGCMSSNLIRNKADPPRQHCDSNSF